ncbi:hypothetical protein [Paludibacter jiangxiensis]|nr:hypothetical protein [Paludibacter jiangxiensis]
MSANSDVLITEHRYTPIYDQSELSGKYCVQFVTFRNTENGMFILRWWRDACLEWCYARKEDGKFGDQKYLDDWTTRFKGIHELNHLGGGVAPWNVQQYTIENENNTLVVYHPDSGKYFDLIFFHFHYMHIYKMKFIYEFFFGHYILPRKVLHYLYKAYVAQLKRKSLELRKIHSKTDGLGVQNQPIGWFILIGHLIKNITKPNRINWLRLWQN